MIFWTNIISYDHRIFLIFTVFSILRLLGKELLISFSTLQLSTEQCGKRLAVWKTPVFHTAQGVFHTALGVFHTAQYKNGKNFKKHSVCLFPRHVMENS